MNKSMPSCFLVIALVSCLLAATEIASAQGDGDVEARFIAMLKNATLKGTWAPVQQGKLGTEKGDDSYRIARVVKSAEGKWSVVSVFNVRDKQIEFPIPATVKFAGDTAVLILDNVRAGPGTANWSARVMSRRRLCRSLVGNVQQGTRGHNRRDDYESRKVSCSH